MTADALGIGLATVNRVVAAFNKDPKSIELPKNPRGRPKFSVNESHQESVRSYIRQADKEGSYITLELIKKDFSRTHICFR